MAENLKQIKEKEEQIKKFKKKLITKKQGEWREEWMEEQKKMNRTEEKRETKEWKRTEMKNWKKKGEE